MTTSRPPWPPRRSRRAAATPWPHPSAGNPRAVGHCRESARLGAQPKGRLTPKPALDSEQGAGPGPGERRDSEAHEAPGAQPEQTPRQGGRLPCVAGHNSVDPLQICDSDCGSLSGIGPGAGGSAARDRRRLIRNHWPPGPQAKRGSASPRSNLPRGARPISEPPSYFRGGLLPSRPFSESAFVARPKPPVPTSPSRGLCTQAASRRSSRRNASRDCM